MFQPIEKKLVKVFVLLYNSETEPKTLRFFTGLFEAVSDWPEKLAAAYKADFGE